MAVITSFATGNMPVGATWVGGVAPVTLDDAIIANLHDVSLSTATYTVGSCEIQAGGTLTGNGNLLILDSESGAGFACDTDGNIVGVLNLKITTGANTSLDLAGVAGNVNNIEVDAPLAGRVFFASNTILDGNLVVTSIGATGVRMSADAETIAIGGYLFVNDLFGHNTWTGDLTIIGVTTVNATLYLPDNSTGSTATFTGLCTNYGLTRVGSNTEDVDIVGSIYNAGVLGHTAYTGDVLLDGKIWGPGSYLGTFREYSDMGGEAMAGDELQAGDVVHWGDYPELSG